MRLLAPAYGYPGTNRVLWGALLEAGDAVGHVIINPGSGPGEVRDHVWTREVSALDDRGVPLLGYLNLAYSRKPVARLVMEASLWQRWYGIVDFFLDCAPSSDVRRTAQVAEILRNSASAGELVANAGTRTSHDVARHFDAVVEHEGPPHFAPGSPGVLDLWFGGRADGAGAEGRIPTGRSWIIHSADQSAASESLRQARSAGVGEIWLTDLGGPNPYRALPSYWPWLVEEIRGHDTTR